MIMDSIKDIEAAKGNFILANEILKIAKRILITAKAIIILAN